MQRVRSVGRWRDPWEFLAIGSLAAIAWKRPRLWFFSTSSDFSRLMNAALSFDGEAFFRGNVRIQRFYGHV